MVQKLNENTPSMEGYHDNNNRKIESVDDLSYDVTANVESKNNHAVGTSRRNGHTVPDARTKSYRHMRNMNDLPPERLSQQRNANREERHPSDEGGGNVGNNGNLEDEYAWSCPKICIKNIKDSHPVVTVDKGVMISSSQESDDHPVIRLSIKKPKHWKLKLTTSASSPSVLMPIIRLVNDKGTILLDSDRSEAASKTQGCGLIRGGKDGLSGGRRVCPVRNVRSSANVFDGGVRGEFSCVSRKSSDKKTEDEGGNRKPLPPRDISLKQKTSGSIEHSLWSDQDEVSTASRFKNEGVLLKRREGSLTTNVKLDRSSTRRDQRSGDSIRGLKNDGDTSSVVGEGHMSNRNKIGLRSKNDSGVCDITSFKGGLKRFGKGRVYVPPRADEESSDDASSSSSSMSLPLDARRKRKRRRLRKLGDNAGDRLLEINSHPLPSYQKATDLLRNGPDLVKLRLQRKARHESSTASPTCRRHKRRLHHQLSPESDEDAMGSNVSRHSEKGLSGRRTQSSGNLCNGNKLLAPNVARILVPCTGVGPKDRNKFCGSLPNHLDGKPSPGDSGDTPESCCNGNNNNDEYLQRFQGDYLTMAAPSSSSSAAAQHQQHNQHHHQQTKNKRNELELRLHPLDPSVLYDQGYGSERSPEEEHPLKAPQPDVCQGRPLEYPFITPESTFEACVLKGSRGLGLSVTGGVDTKEQWPGLIRIKRLFPHQPAWQTGQLSQGDILLAANGVALSGLSNYQALEVLRKTPSSVVLTVCRPPSDVFSDPPPSEPPPPPRRDPAHSITGRTAILPLPPLQTEGPTGEFDIHLTKVNHSLGFTLRKEDESVLGHYVRALVREPALSDGRIRPGDKIVAVNDVDISPMSHEEAVMFLRQCGDHVKLRLYRDAAQTPVSALSPTEESKLFRPKPILRKEAMDMLCDLAVRKLSPGDNSTGSSSYTRLRRVSDGQSSSSPSSSPRRRKLTKTPSPDAQPLTQERIAQKYLVSSHVGNSDSSGEGSNTNTCTYQSSFDSTAARGRGSSFASSEEGGGPELRPQRPNFLDLCGASSLPGTARKQRFTFSTDGEEEGSLCHTGSDEPDTLGSVSRLCPSDDEAADRCDLPLEPTSMPPLTNLSSTSSTSTAFSYRNPAYQSACPAMRGKVVEEVHEHASDQDIPGKVFGSCPGGAEGTRGLLKWKGVVFTPESDPAEEDVIDEGETIKSTGECLKQKQREGQVFMVELTRGWNSRLGFSLQSDGSDTYISAIYADSVAAKDGRLRAGDQVIMVNDEDITNMTTSDLIDLLRKIRGTIGITVLRKTGPRPQAS